MINLKWCIFCSLFRITSVSDIWGGLPVTRKRFQDVPAEHDFFWTSLPSTWSSRNKLWLQDTFSAATLIIITTRNRSWFPLSLWQWMTGVLTRKALNLKELETLPTLIIQLQVINKVLHSGFPCGNSVLQWPYNLTSYAFICYIRWNVPVDTLQWVNAAHATYVP